MPVELDEKLRAKLVKLLDRVPSLDNRAVRDAWLKCLPKNAQDQITSRHDNRKIDLTFIVDAVQTIRLQDGEWAILILLDDLLKGLEGIEIGNDIQKVREAIAGALERPSEEPGELSPGPPRYEPTWTGDPKRKQWVDRRGFKRDPFGYIDGGTDPFLQEYFYFGMRHFYDVSDVSRPGTIFVFGPPGSGKSSMRNVIAQLCRKESIFPVVYQDFGPLARKHASGEGVQAEDHVTQILRIALGSLAEADLAKEPGKEDTSSPETEESRIIRDQLWLYASRYEEDPLRKLALKGLLKPGPRARGKLPGDPRELLGRFCRYVAELFGYQSVYILVDPEDDVAPDEDSAWQVLEPLLSTRRLLELSDYSVAFKFFLSQKFLKRVQEVPWIDEEQSKRVREIVWSDDESDDESKELHALLRERLWQSSDGRYESLGELSEVEGLDDRVIRLSMGSPRELIVTCDRLFGEHCRRWSPDDEETLLITAQEVEDALRQSEERHRESPLEQLIAEGESERVEFKSTMRYNRQAGRPDKEMEWVIARTLAAFMNTEGGTLIIGVEDDGTVLGLDEDFSTLGRRKTKDGFEQAFVNITENLFDSPVSPDDYTARFEEYRGKLVYVVEVKKSGKPVFCSFDGEIAFSVRKQTTTRNLDAKATLEYCSDHFKK